MIEPGWYPAEGDPPGTARYWDGYAWQGGPEAMPQPASTPLGSIPPQGAVPDQSSPSSTFGWEAQQQQRQSQDPGKRSPIAGSNHIDNLTPFQYLKRAYTKDYSNFNGRARRAEYGWVTLITCALAVGIVFPGFYLFGSMDFGNSGTAEALLIGGFFLLVLAVFIPGLALQVRRWHDLNLSGWFELLAFLVQFVPVFGPLIGLGMWLYLLFADSKPEWNKWGYSPKYG